MWKKFHWSAPRKKIYYEKLTKNSKNNNLLFSENPQKHNLILVKQKIKLKIK